MQEIKIRDFMGDYALDIPFNSDDIVTLYFNSRQNALNIKRILEVDCSVPNHATVCDMVEVVRCKDCKHWHNGDCYRLELSLPNDFCSYGERKGEGE